MNLIFSNYWELCIYLTLCFFIKAYTRIINRTLLTCTLHTYHIFFNWRPMFQNSLSIYLQCYVKSKLEKVKIVTIFTFYYDKLIPNQKANVSFSSSKCKNSKSKCWNSKSRSRGLTYAKTFLVSSKHAFSGCKFVFSTWNIILLFLCQKNSNYLRF